MYFTCTLLSACLPKMLLLWDVSPCGRQKARATKNSFGGGKGENTAHPPDSYTHCLSGCALWFMTQWGDSQCGISEAGWPLYCALLGATSRVGAGRLVVYLRLIPWLKNKHAKECPFVTERCLSRITKFQVSIKRGDREEERRQRGSLPSLSLSRRALPLSRRTMLLSLSIQARTRPINLSISTF